MTFLILEILDETFGVVFLTENLIKFIKKHLIVKPINKILKYQITNLINCLLQKLRSTK